MSSHGHNYHDRDRRGYNRDDRRGYRGDDRRDDRELQSGRDRNRDRRYDDRRLPHDDYVPRRDGSRDRKRDRSPARDGPYDGRERHGEYRDRRDGSRERKRSRRSDSVESKHRMARDDSRNRNTAEAKRARQVAENEAIAIEYIEEQRKKLERQAKIAEWKKKQLKAAKAPAVAAASPRPASAGSGPQSPATPASTAFSPVATLSGSMSPSVELPVEEDSHDISGPGKSYAGKFDPRAIAKRAAAASSRLKAATLESDVSIPGKSKSTALPPTSAHKAADYSKKPLANQVAGSISSAGQLAPSAVPTGFGLNQDASDEMDLDQAPNVDMIDMDDEHVHERRLEKLPTPEFDNIGDTARANEEDTIDDQSFLEATNEEEAAAAARAAAEKRAAAAQESDQMNDVQYSPAFKHHNVMSKLEEALESVDPLDAFMDGLDTDVAEYAPKSRNAGRLLEAQAQYNDEEYEFGLVAEEIDDEDTPAAIIQHVLKKKKKEVPAIDHSKVKYESFRRNFYTEPQELQDMDDEEVRALRFELDNIKVEGSNVPKPVQKFAQFGLGSQVLDVIRNMGFEKPSSIQAQTIPAIMSGRDVIAVAKTGSGKTVAFLLPMFRHIKDQRKLENMEGPIGLIMAPTRELATQIHRECKPYLKALGLRAVCAYGGAPIKDQIAELKRGAEIVVCTPGRMIDLLAANAGRVINLSRVTYVVLDEADRMFDMGFEPSVTKILSNSRPDRQTVLFSATLSHNMENLARKALRKPVQITVGGRSVVAAEIDQEVEVRTEASKWFRLLELLGDLFEEHDDARALVFVERQESADTLLMKMQKAGYPCVSIHGGREQIDRDLAISDFKAGAVPVMVATSVAARGLDVQQLKLVVNYDVPNHLEDYVHRAGRTGRAGNKGTAITFITPEQDKYSVDLVKALNQSNSHVPEDLKELADGFLAKVKSGTEKAARIGFGGKGLDVLDAKRDAERKRERKIHKVAGEPDEPEEDDKKKKPDKIEVKSRDAPESTPTSAPAPARQAIPGMPRGYDPDAAIDVRRTEVPAPSAAPSSMRDRAAAAAARIDSRLGSRNSARPGVPIDNKGPDAGAFHATLEINEWPQKARWAVTNRTNVAKVLDSTGTSITSKGNYYLPGKEPGPNDLPKLYILVEGDTENQVTSAMRQLQTLLKDGAIAAAEADAKAPMGGRYSVT